MVKQFIRGKMKILIIIKIMTLWTCLKNIQNNETIVLNQVRVVEAV
jgi:hypothetical protein